MIYTGIIDVNIQDTKHASASVIHTQINCINLIQIYIIKYHNRIGNFACHRYRNWAKFWYRYITSL